MANLVKVIMQRGHKGKPHLCKYMGRWVVFSPKGKGFNSSGWPQGQSFDDFHVAAEKAKECR